MTTDWHHILRNPRLPSGRTAHRAFLRRLAECDQALHDHADSVQKLALAVGERLGLTERELSTLGRAACLHDVGKLLVSDAILAKPGPLTVEEWEQMRQHTVLGARLLNQAPGMREVALLVRASHEQFDGSGYPDGLAGEEIPLGSRVILACDAFDAMTSERAYSEAVEAEAALEELRRCAGSQFDPVVVEILVGIVDADLAGATPPASVGAGATG